MNVRELLRTRREEILRAAAKRGARNLRVFGSVARGEADSESDVDLLVDLEPGRSLLDHAGLLVDVASEQGMRPRIRERVLREAVPL